MAGSTKKIGAGVFSVGAATVAGTTADLAAVDNLRVSIGAGAASISSFGSGANKLKYVRAGVAFTLVQSGTLLLPGRRDLEVLEGDTFLASSSASGAWRVESFQRANGAPPRSPMGQIAGLTLSNDSGTPNSLLNISVGAATSDAGEVLIDNLASKTINFAGAAGVANRLDTGTVAANTWYDIYVIMTAAYVVSTLAVVAGNTPVLPSGYLYKRRIGSVRTNASAQLIAFTQIGDDFFWAAPVSDHAGVAVTTAAGQLFALTVPPSVKVRPHLRLGGATRVLLTDPSMAEQAPAASLGAAPGYDQNGSAAAFSPYLYTNTARQIRARAETAGTIDIITRGWNDPRGRNL